MKLLKYLPALCAVGAEWSKNHQSGKFGRFRHFLKHHSRSREMIRGNVEWNTRQYAHRREQVRVNL